jgi:hypothetical protein
MFKYCDILRITDDLRVKNFSTIEQASANLLVRLARFDEVTAASALTKQKKVDAKYSYTAHILTFTNQLCGDKRLLEDLVEQKLNSSRSGCKQATVVGFNFPEAD